MGVWVLQLAEQKGGGYAPHSEEVPYKFYRWMDSVGGLATSLLPLSIRIFIITNHLVCLHNVTIGLCFPGVSRPSKFITTVCRRFISSGDFKE